MSKCVFNGGDICIALTQKKCEGCNFFKTKKQLDEGRKKARRRISALPVDLQLYIKDKYSLPLVMPTTAKGTIW